MFRSTLYRAGRYLYLRTRLELPNKPDSNGEYWLLSKAISEFGAHAIFLDVGANKGDWTQKALETARNNGSRLSVVAFEPSGFTRSLLCGRFADNASVEVCDMALSSKPGTATFYSGSNAAGTNSLHRVSGTKEETISVTTLDEFLAGRKPGHVNFIKIDTEGFDALVIAGARASLERGDIDLIQFEYNWRWLLNSQSLRDVFQMIEGLPYRLGKLAGEQILLFKEWHFEMDRFFEGNYVLIRRGTQLEKLGKESCFDHSNVLSFR